MSKYTAEQNRKWREFKQQGYTMCVVSENGDLVPGYHHWIIEFVLDEIEAKTWFDEIGQAYRERDNEPLVTAGDPQAHE